MESCLNMSSTDKEREKVRLSGALSCQLGI